MLEITQKDMAICTGGANPPLPPPTTTPQTITTLVGLGFSGNPFAQAAAVSTQVPTPLQQLIEQAFNLMAPPPGPPAKPPGGK